MITVRRWLLLRKRGLILRLGRRWIFLCGRGGTLNGFLGYSWAGLSRLHMGITIIEVDIGLSP